MVVDTYEVIQDSAGKSELIINLPFFVFSVIISIFEITSIETKNPFCPTVD